MKQLEHMHVDENRREMQYEDGDEVNARYAMWCVSRPGTRTIYKMQCTNDVIPEAKVSGRSNRLLL